MARNQTDYAIRIYCIENNTTKRILAKKLALEYPTFLHKMRRGTFTEFETEQLKTIGVDFTVSYL
jgi:hypothetical protein